MARAGLDCSIPEGCGDCFRDALHPIHDGDQNVLDAPVAQFIHYREPELGARCRAKQSNTSSELAILAGTQTFNGNKTLSGTLTASGTVTTSGATATIGTSTGTATYGMGTGATTTGVTKTVNLGTGGASGSTTVVNIGSATAGAGGTTVINTPTVTFVGCVANVVEIAEQRAPGM